MVAVHQDFPVFKGLQHPLELLGFQGRYIIWAACTAGGAIVGFIIGYVAIGFVAALVLLTVVLSAGGVMIFLKQRKGLYSKPEEHGIYIISQRTKRI